MTSAEKQREIYAQRKAAGMCTRGWCKRPASAGASRCRPHMKAVRKYNRRPWYFDKKAAGLCVRDRKCPEQASDTCLLCDKHRRMQREYYARTNGLPGHRATNARACRRKRARYKRDGRCYHCGSKDLASETMCWKHLEASRKAQGTRRGRPLTETERRDIATAGLGSWGEMPA